MGPIRLGWQYVLSVIFIAQMYLMMAVVALVFLPYMLITPKGALAACHFYSRWVVASARIIVGLRTEVRGTPPQMDALLAAKHQSFYDILAIMAVIPRPRFVMKRELIYTPLLGQYALRLGCIPVDRSQKGGAMKKMLSEVSARMASGGQLVIYPQGTRVAPGAYEPYKVGTGALYLSLGLPCVPVATNIGMFWPKHGILRKPGVTVVEFLDPIEPGRKLSDFMGVMEERIEEASDRLMQEAGLDLEAARLAHPRPEPELTAAEMRRAKRKPAPDA